MRDDHGRRWTARPATPRSVEVYRTSTHGTGAAAGDPDAPTCFDCHEKHAVMSRKLPASPTFPRNVPELCARCHREGEQAAVRIHSDVPIVDSYRMSIHGKGLNESGLLVTATCVNCHTAHGVLPPDDPNSMVHDDHVADTCGQCHLGIEEAFKTSIHWPANAQTDLPLPTCKDCHTSHQISRADQDDFRLLMIEPVRDLPRGGDEDLLREHRPRPVLAPRLRQEREVLRLPRLPQDPAARRPRPRRSARKNVVADLRAVPHRRPPPVRRLPHARDAPRPQEVPVALLDLLGHDHAAGGHPGRGPRPHGRVAGPPLAVAQRVEGAQGGAPAREGREALPPLRPLPAHAAPADDALASSCSRSPA